MGNNTKTEAGTTERDEAEGKTPFGQRLYRSRAKLGYSQREVARRIGLSNNSVSKWERGDIDCISAVNLFRTAELLNVDAYWLLTGETKYK